MAWPKGKPRKPKAESAPEAEAPSPVVKAATERTRPLMRARPNWDDFVPEPDNEAGQLHIPRDMFPPGFDFQWVTDTVYGQSMPQHRAKFERGGWAPVYQDDFDGTFDGKFMPKGAQGEITVDGLVLMARPLRFSIAAKKRDLAAAREAVMIKQQQLTGGDMPGVSLDSKHATALRSNRIVKTVEPFSVPDE